MTDAQGRAYGGETQIERESARREKLLDAALKIIGTQGVRAATVRALCAEAGLSPRYYYQAFDSLEDLFVQLYRKQTKRLESVVLIAMNPVMDKPKSMARAGLSAFFQELKSDPHLTRVLFIEYTSVNTQVEQINQESFDYFIDLILKIVRPYYQSNFPKNLNEKIISTALIGATVQLANSWYLAGFDEQVNELVENLLFIVSSLAQKIGIAFED